MRSDVIDSAIDEYSYQFNLNLSITITEEETDEVETEFTHSIKEIEGSESFACIYCQKVCKSHQLEAYNEARECVTVKTNHIPLCEGTIVSTVESIKSNLLEKDYYGKEIQNGLKNIVGGEAFLDALQALYVKFCRKKNMDKLLESFYGLIPRSCELLNCDDYRVANLVMVQIPDHLAIYYEINHTRTTTESSSTRSKQEIDHDERGPFSYLAGYVVSKLHKTCVKSLDKNNKELLSLLRNMKSPEGLTNSFISARTRGARPCHTV